MTTKVIDEMDLGFYPLQRGMTINEIKAVSMVDIIAGCKPIIAAVAKSYEGTLYEVNKDRALRHLKFIAMLKHTGGSLSGITFRLLPFQVEFIIQSLNVVNISTGLRKHREATMFIPRKNGKTELGAALNLLMLFLDEEQGKELYSIASTTDQASILYQASVVMLRQNPTLTKKVKQYKANKKLEVVNSTFLDTYKVLSSIADSKDGLRANGIFVDEFHAFPDSSLFDVMVESTINRTEPMVFIMSTAGYNKQGTFHKKLEYAKQVMGGIIKDDYVYLMDFSIDDEKDWLDEEKWWQCNPAMGFGTLIDGLRDKANKALHSATDEVSFKTKHLNLWVDSAITWIRDTDWLASSTTPFTEDDLIGRECYAGLDLASTTDLTAFVLVFPREDGGYEILPRFFMPEDTMRRRSKEDKVSYAQWVKEGFIRTTEGNVVDYGMLYQYIVQDLEKFDCREISFDRWNATGIITKLEEFGANCVGFGQGYKSMSSPTKAIEALTLQKKLNHNDNPVLRWNVANVAIITDPADNVKMDKSKSQERIDGAVALAMAIGRAETYKDETADWQSLIG